ncbi:hypothetical protein [Megamonas funiformis]|jgi:predicted RNA methylase|uniref:Uncharacterized protein n=1 Tax=Megamonas funiformis TaxID=437897 RepID=A0AAW4U8E3_9FIRM|nr:hypothetical protein [Megamonas funiformis]MCB6829327.1 hypothetical protein [Megamonas funiformis]
MFIGLYISDSEKEKAIKKAINKIDSNIEILDSHNCLEFTWDQEYLEDNIDLYLGKNISKEERQQVLKAITENFLEYDFQIVTDEIVVFIAEIIKKYRKGQYNNGTKK